MCKMRDGILTGIQFRENALSVSNCEVCALAKQSRNPFSNSKRTSKNALELIHSDLVGPMETQSIGKAKFLLTFIDDYTRKIFVYFIHSKSDVFEKFKEFKNFVEKQRESSIKCLRTDNGTEYLSVKFDKFLKDQGIQDQRTTPYTLEQNGTAERFNRTIIERAKCLLFDAKLPKCYWA